MEVSGQLHAPAAFLQKKVPITHWIKSGVWIQIWARLDAVEKRKITALPEIEPRQTVASTYTDWAISAHICCEYKV
jgi:hypothetical protein